MSAARPLAAPLACLLLAACGGEPGGPPRTDDGSAAAADADAALANTQVALELVQAPGFELVLQHCVTCHGPRQFLQQRGDRDTWLGLIRWMQQDHGMPQLPDGVEDRIVEYLATHYGPERGGRRRPIPAELMPPNPYARD